MADLGERNLELKVGVFIAIGIIILCIIAFSIGDVYFYRRGYHINVIFSFANGIAESAPVRVAGVNVGQIDDIELFFDEKERKTKVRLLAWIGDNDVKVERDATVVINTLGLLGEKYLEIFPGTKTGDVLKANDDIIGHDPVSVELLTEKMEKLVDSTNTVVARLKEGKGTVGKLLVEEKIYRDLEELVEDIKKNPWKLLHKPKEKK